MPLWLQILIGILVVVSIITIIIIFSTMRRMSNVIKKIDYIVEDLTYKAESFSETVEAIKGFSKYINLFQSLIDDQNPQKSEYVKQNRKKIMALSKYLSKIAQEKE
ncbi:hypothetical protein MCAV_04520 [[Mycoplasma] cavipharyngis]|uniref:hypothetical protein n=1 Tax=[Mycoplasma] cavipharyngis TaxID=92757 RepID=UPI003703D72B